MFVDGSSLSVNYPGGWIIFERLSQDIAKGKEI
jgi:hypothetical protein